MLAVLLAASPAYAIDYFVNDDSIEGDVYTWAPGDDRASGLSAHAPKASLSGILEAYVLGPGDRVLIDSGRYVLGGDLRVRIGPEHRGTPEAPIIIQGAFGPGRTVFASRPDDPADVFLLAGDAPDRPVQHVLLANLRFETATWGIAFSCARRVTIDRCTFTGQQARARPRGTSDARPQPAAGIMGDLWDTSSEAIIIRRSVFRDIGGAAILLWNVRDAQILDCTFDDNAPGYPGAAGPGTAQVQLRGLSTGATLLGNLYHVGAQGSAAVSVDRDAAPGFSSDLAAYDVTGEGAVVGIWCGVPIHDLAAWQSKENAPVPVATDGRSVQGTPAVEPIYELAESLRPDRVTLAMSPRPRPGPAPTGPVVVANPTGPGPEVSPTTDPDNGGSTTHLPAEGTEPSPGESTAGALPPVAPPLGRWIRQPDQVPFYFEEEGEEVVGRRLDHYYDAYTLHLRAAAGTGRWFGEAYYTRLGQNGVILWEVWPDGETYAVRTTEGNVESRSVLRRDESQPVGAPPVGMPPTAPEVAPAATGVAGVWLRDDGARFEFQGEGRALGWRTDAHGYAWYSILLRRDADGCYRGYATYAVSTDTPTQREAWALTLTGSDAADLTVEGGLGPQRLVRVSRGTSEAPSGEPPSQGEPVAPGEPGAVLASEVRPTEWNGRPGLLIVSLGDASTLGRMGAREGDILLAVNGLPVPGGADPKNFLDRIALENVAMAEVVEGGEPTRLRMPAPSPVEGPPSGPVEGPIPSGGPPEAPPVPAPIETPIPSGGPPESRTPETVEPAILPDSASVPPAPTEPQSSEPAPSVPVAPEAPLPAPSAPPPSSPTALVTTSAPSEPAPPAPIAPPVAPTPPASPVPAPEPRTPPIPEPAPVTPPAPAPRPGEPRLPVQPVSLPVPSPAEGPAPEVRPTPVAPPAPTTSLLATVHTTLWNGRTGWLVTTVEERSCLPSLGIRAGDIILQVNGRGPPPSGDPGRALHESLLSTPSLTIDLVHDDRRMSLIVPRPAGLAAPPAAPAAPAAPPTAPVTPPSAPATEPVRPVPPASTPAPEPPRMEPLPPPVVPHPAEVPPAVPPEPAPVEPVAVEPAPVEPVAVEPAPVSAGPVPEPSPVAASPADPLVGIWVRDDGAHFTVSFDGQRYRGQREDARDEASRFDFTLQRDAEGRLGGFANYVHAVRHARTSSRCRASLLDPETLELAVEGRPPATYRFVRGETDPLTPAPLPQGGEGEEGLPRKAGARGVPRGGSSR